MFLAYANYVRADDAFTYFGRSCVCDPTGADLARAEGGEEMIFADLGKPALAAARREATHLADRRPELYRSLAATRGPLSAMPLPYHVRPGLSLRLRRLDGACRRARFDRGGAARAQVATLGLCDGVIPKMMSKTLFARERHGLFCRRGHRFHGVGDLRLDDPARRAVHQLHGGRAGRAAHGPCHRGAAFASFGQWVRATSSNVEEVQRIIRTGIGIGILPVHPSRELVASCDLWQLPPYEDQPVTEIFQIFNPGSPLNAAGTVFLERCREVPACDHL